MDAQQLREDVLALWVDAERLVTLPNTIAEIQQWLKTSRSCFTDLLTARGLHPQRRRSSINCFPFPPIHRAGRGALAPPP